MLREVSTVGRGTAVIFIAASADQKVSSSRSSRSAWRQPKKNGSNAMGGSQLKLGLQINVKHAKARKRRVLLLARKWVEEGACSGK